MAKPTGEKLEALKNLRSKCQAMVDGCDKLIAGDDSEGQNAAKAMSDFQDAVGKLAGEGKTLDAIALLRMVPRYPAAR